MGAFDKKGQNSTYTISRLDIDRFAAFGGDHNPIHFGPDAIVPGMLLLHKASGAVSRIAGDGAMFIGISNLEFLRPIRPDETFMVFVGYPEAVPNSSRNESRVSIEISKDCRGRRKVVVRGEAILIPKQAAVAVNTSAVV